MQCSTSRFTAFSSASVKMMYAAVFMGGPRWNGGRPKEARGSNISLLRQARPVPTNRNLLQRGFSRQAILDENAQVQEFILSNNPSIEQLEKHLRDREIKITTRIGNR